MDPEERAEYLLELFDDNKEHAIRCAKELMKLEADTFMTEFYWDDVIRNLKD